MQQLPRRLYTRYVHRDILILFMSIIYFLRLEKSYTLTAEEGRSWKGTKECNTRYHYTAWHSREPAIKRCGSMLEMW